MQATQRRRCSDCDVPVAMPTGVMYWCDTCISNQSHSHRLCSRLHPFTMKKYRLSNSRSHQSVLQQVTPRATAGHGARAPSHTPTDRVLAASNRAGQVTPRATADHGAHVPSQTPTCQVTGQVTLGFTPEHGARAPSHTRSGRALAASHRTGQVTLGVTPEHGARGRPAAAVAVDRAVAEVPAAGARPRRVGEGFLHVLAVPHEETVATELAMQGLAVGARCAQAHSLLAALVAGHSVHWVVHLQEKWNFSELFRDYLATVSDGSIP